MLLNEGVTLVEIERKNERNSDSRRQQMGEDRRECEELKREWGWRGERREGKETLEYQSNPHKGQEVNEKTPSEG